MAVTRDEAASEGEGQVGNPISKSNPNPNPNPNSIPNPNSNSPHSNRGIKGKSCKGCAYYSSLHRAKSKNPTCVGFSRTLQQVPPSVVGETESKASKESLNLTNFKYGCVGYSIYLDNKDSSADLQDKTSKLPYCIGLEVLMVEKASNAPVSRVPTTRKTEEQEQHQREHIAPDPRQYKPQNIKAEEFFNRFKKSATLVASGVVRDLNRVGNYVKETLGDYLNKRHK